jgi:transposase
MSALVQFWTPERYEAVSVLAQGYSQQEAAERVGVSSRTIWNWLQNPEFAAEVDRLTLMIDAASRAERMREVYRVLRAKRQEDGALRTDKDSLDWLKYAQSETDGVKLDLSKLTDLDDASGSGQPSSSPQDVVGPSTIDVVADPGALTDGPIDQSPTTTDGNH